MVSEQVYYAKNTRRQKILLAGQTPFAADFFTRRMHRFTKLMKRSTQRLPRTIRQLNRSPPRLNRWIRRLLNMLAKQKYCHEKQ